MENPSGRRFPESLRLTISLDGEPLPGGWVVVTIHTLHKNDFHCEFGPAGSAGRIFIDHDRVETLRRFPIPRQPRITKSAHVVGRVR